MIGYSSRRWFRPTLRRSKSRRSSSEPSLPRPMALPLSLFLLRASRKRSPPPVRPRPLSSPTLLTLDTLLQSLSTLPLTTFSHPFRSRRTGISRPESRSTFR